jgi:hypothetical protein
MKTDFDDENECTPVNLFALVACRVGGVSGHGAGAPA